MLGVAKLQQTLLDPMNCSMLVTHLNSRKPNLEPASA